MPIATSVSLDVRGRSITTFIAYETLKRLAGMADGDSLELLTDASEEIDNDLRAWCRSRAQEIVAVRRTDDGQQYVITKGPLRPSRSAPTFTPARGPCGTSRWPRPIWPSTA
jgi:TusA-related sulfurtransferase